MAATIRIDQLTGLRVLLADPPRHPHGEAFQRLAGSPTADPDCPLCEGNERLSAPELWAARPGDAPAPDAPGWSARALPADPPLAAATGPERPGALAGPETGFTSSADPLHASTRGAEQGLFGSQPAAGSHELIAACRRHATSLAQLSEAELRDSVGAWRERMAALAPGAAQLILSVEQGLGVEPRPEHTHAELVALGFVPPAVARERERAAAYNERTMGGHLLADVAAAEIRRRERLVAIDDDAILLCPWASRSPYELRVVPRGFGARFESDSAGTQMLATALRALAARLGDDVPLRLWVRTAPRDAEEFCWHIDLAPQLAAGSGFELASGIAVNELAPERAARELREALAGGATGAE